MQADAAIEEGYHLLEVALKSFTVLVGGLFSKDLSDTEDDSFAEVFLKKVKQRVDFPHRCWICAVVAEADAEGAENGVRLADRLTTLFPDWQTA